MLPLAVSIILIHNRRGRYVRTGNAGCERQWLSLVVRLVRVCGLLGQDFHLSSFDCSRPQSTVLEAYGPTETRANFSWESGGRD